MVYGMHCSSQTDLNALADRPMKRGRDDAKPAMEMMIVTYTTTWSDKQSVLFGRVLDWPRQNEQPIPPRSSEDRRALRP